MSSWVTRSCRVARAATSAVLTSSPAQPRIALPHSPPSALARRWVANRPGGAGGGEVVVAPWRTLSSAVGPGADAAGAGERGMTNEDGRLLFVATCQVCQGVIRREFSKQAYRHGVVIVQCGGCGSRHLVADNLGWFGEAKNIEEEMNKAGKTLVRVFEGTHEALQLDTSASNKPTDK